LDDLRSGRNVDLYVLFLVAVAVTLGALFGFLESETVSATVLEMLALLAVSLLGLRYQIAELSTLSITDEPLVDSLPLDFDDMIAAATEVLFCGSSLNGVVGTHRPELAALLRSGGRVRVILGPTFERK
jgi:hypothetical protein